MSGLTKGRDGRGRLRRRGEGRPARPAPARGAGIAPARRTAGTTQDTALYSCACGFVFEADVSTSVGCPHCGGTQAW